MKSLLTWLERLSLDAVIVAVVWGVALSGLAGRSGVFRDMLILGLATWLTCVADRLWEVRPGGQFPSTDRHAYYKRHYKLFRNLWVFMFAATAATAAAVLPDWKFLQGWGLVLLIIVYLLALAGVRGSFKRLLVKRVAVPLIFTAGILWMSEGWNQLEPVAASLVLLWGSFTNFLLISYRENRDNAMPAWLPRFALLSVFVLLGCANVALFIDLRAGVAGLACFLGYFMLYIHLRAGRDCRVRSWADGILAASGLLLIALV